MKENDVKIIQANLNHVLNNPDLMEAADQLTLAGSKGRDLLVECIYAIDSLKKRADLRDVTMVGDPAYEHIAKNYLTDQERKHMHFAMMNNDHVRILYEIDRALDRWARFGRMVVELIQNADKVRQEKFRMISGQI